MSGPVQVSGEETIRPNWRKQAGVVLGVMMLTGVAVAIFLAAIFGLKAIRAPGWTIGIAAGVYGLAVTGLALLGAKSSMKAMKVRPSPAARRYQRRFTACILTYIAAFAVSLVTYNELRPADLFAVAAAIFPALPLIGCIIVMGLYLREETDEFLRSVAVESALWGLGGVLLIGTVWGFLETFRVVPHVPAWAVFPLWAVLMGAGQAIAGRRYQ